MRRAQTGTVQDDLGLAARAAGLARRAGQAPGSWQLRQPVGSEVAASLDARLGRQPRHPHLTGQRRLRRDLRRYQRPGREDRARRNDLRTWS